MPRTILRWTFDQGLPFHFPLPVYDEVTGEPFADWAEVHRVYLELVDRIGTVIIAFDSDGGTDGTVELSVGQVDFRATSEVTAALETTTTMERGKTKAQLFGRILATFPSTPDDPEFREYVKAVVVEA